MTSPYLFHLGAAPQVSASGRAVGLGAGATDFPPLSGLSASVLTLPAGAVQGPLWHANAGLLGYCIQGATLVTILSPGDIRDCFALGADELFFVEQGFAYSLASVAAGPTELVMVASHERPVDFALPDLIAALPACARAQVAKLSPRASSPHKLALREIAPMVSPGGASLRIASCEELSILDRLAIGSLRLRPSGMSEPHWHPNCGELGYVLGGRARLSLVGPSCERECFEIGLGDLYYVPPSYPHWQEALGDDEVHIISGFGHHQPMSIRLADAIAAVPAPG
jgi:oxalate decarboxylase